MLLEMPEHLRIADGHANNIDGSIARHDEDEKDDDDDDSLTPVQERRVLEAAKRMLALARNAWTGEYTSPNGKSPYQLLLDWLELAERFPESIGLPPDKETQLPMRHPDDKLPDSETNVLDPTFLPVRQIVERDGLARFPDQAGRLWTGLAHTISSAVTLTLPGTPLSKA